MKALEKHLSLLLVRWVYDESSITKISLSYMSSIREPPDLVHQPLYLRLSLMGEVRHNG